MVKTTLNLEKPLMTVWRTLHATNGRNHRAKAILKLAVFTVEDVNHWLSRFIVEFGKLNGVLPSKCLYYYKYSTYEACASRETLLWMRRSTISLASERRYVLKWNSCHQRLVFVLVNFIMHVQWMRGKNLCKNKYICFGFLLLDLEMHESSFSFLNTLFDSCLFPYHILRKPILVDCF